MKQREPAPPAPPAPPSSGLNPWQRLGRWLAGTPERPALRKDAPLLSAQGLRVSVGSGGNERVLVRELSFQVQAGEFWCLLGRNGVGKTQLLHTLAGAQAPSAGQVTLAGQLLADWPIASLACLRGYVPQSVHDAFSTPVLDVVLQGRHPHLSRWHWEGAADDALALAALARVGLNQLAERDVSTLSGGERQRVALATLLTQDPPLALLDEPLAHLDLAQQARMLSLLAAESRVRRRAILMSIHDVSLAQRVATHALLLHPDGHCLGGPVASVMTAQHLSAAFGHPLHRHEVDGRVWWLPG